MSLHFTSLLTVFFLIALQPVSAQLNGYWKLEEDSVEGQWWNTADTSLLHFSRDGNLYYVTIHNSTCSYKEKGKWSQRKNRIKTESGVFSGSPVFIQNLTPDSLVLISISKDLIFRKQIWIRVQNNNTLIPLMESFWYEPPPPVAFKLLNRFDISDTICIPHGTRMKLVFDQIPQDTVSYDYYYTRLKIYQVQRQDSLLCVNYEEEELDFYSPELPDMYYLSNKPGYTCLPVNSLQSVSLTWHRGEVLKGVGTGLISAGLLTSLIVAPLVAIDYSNGQIRENRYYPVAASGLITMGIGIPLTLSKSSKTYLLNNCHQKNNWILLP